MFGEADGAHWSADALKLRRDVGPDADSPSRSAGGFDTALRAPAASAERSFKIPLWAGHFGDPMLALDAMRAAIEEQGSRTVYLWLPQLAPMRRLPEFKTFMRDIGMVEYWQEYGWPSFCRQVDGDDFVCN